MIDITAVFAMLFGLATSLGFGAEKAMGGIEFLFGVESTSTCKTALIVVITAVALVSVVAGLDAGAKRLSEINMVLPGTLLAFILLAGRTLVIATGIPDNTAAYFKTLIPLSNPFWREDTNLMRGWTAIY